MIKINLLPFRTAKKLENIRMQVSVFVLSVVLTLAVLGFFFLRVNSELKDVQGKNAQLKKELASYSDMLKRVDNLKKKREDLKGKLEVIQNLEAQKAGPVMLFDEISIAVPKGKLFLKNLSESGDKVSMSGIARDYDTVALFMTRLENTQSIKTVALGSTNKSEMGGQEINNFTLTCMKDLGGKIEENNKKKGKKRRKRK